jgi:hypothetical protein
MGRACTICSHRERAAIEAAAVGGEPNRRIAPRFGLSEKAIRRHLGAHLPRALAVAAEARGLAQADTLLEKVHTVEADARRLLEKAEKSGDFRCAIAAAKTSLDVIEMLLKVREAERALAAGLTRAELEAMSDEELDALLNGLQPRRVGVGRR